MAEDSPEAPCPPVIAAPPGIVWEHPRWPDLAVVAFYAATNNEVDGLVLRPMVIQGDKLVDPGVWIDGTGSVVWYGP